MIRSKSIKKLIEEIVVKTLSTTLTPIGFKYVKTQNSFKKAKDDFTQFISVGQDNSPLVYDENDDKLYLKFSLHSSVKHLKFDKWITEKLKTRSNFRHSVTPIHSIVEVNQSLLEQDDFYEPTKSQAFKNYVSRSIAGPDNKERIDISKLPAALSDLSNKLDSLCDIPVLFEQRSQAYRDYFRLLVYNGNKQEAIKHYTKSINDSKHKIEKQLKDEPEEAKKSIQGLERFSEECKTLLDIEIKVDFDRSLKKIVSKQQRVRLSKNLGY